MILILSCQLSHSDFLIPFLLTKFRHLEYHKRKHQSDKRYSCPREDCPEKFYYSDAVKWHLIRHHREQAPFTCNRCSPSKPFIHEKTWETHEKGHEKNGGFSIICPICAISISESRHMKRHMRTHDEKSFKVSRKLFT